MASHPHPEAHPSRRDDTDIANQREHNHAAQGHGAHGHGGHGLMMIACCIPMLAIAGVLAFMGVLSLGFLLFAVGCTAMMALMMRGMSASNGPTP